MGARDGMPRHTSEASKASDGLALATEREHAAQGLVRGAAARDAVTDALVRSAGTNDEHDSGSQMPADTANATRRGARTLRPRRKAEATEPEGNADGTHGPRADDGRPHGGKHQAGPSHGSDARLAAPASKTTNAEARGSQPKPKGGRAPFGGARRGWAGSLAAGNGDASSAWGSGAQRPHAPSARLEGTTSMTRKPPSHAQERWRRDPASPLRSAQRRRNYMASRQMAAGHARATGSSVAGASSASASSSAAVAAETGTTAAAGGVAAVPVAVGVAVTMVVALALSGILVGGAASQGGASAGRLSQIAISEYEAGKARGDYWYRGQKYWEYAYGSQVHWCGCFVSWCFGQAGLVDSGFIERSAGASWYVDWFKGHPESGEVHVSSGDAYLPVEGDLFVRNYGDYGGSDHVGIVVGNDGDKVFYTVEGNTSGGPSNSFDAASDGFGGYVNRKSHRLGEANFSFVHPRYPATSGMGDIAIPETSGGTTIGTYGTRELDLAAYTFPSGSTQRQVQELWRQHGSVTDALGFNTLDGRYLVALTSTFGSVGDEVTFYFSDGSHIDCVMVDEKSQSYVPWDHNPANAWGHDNGANVLEFCGTPAIGSNPYIALGKSGLRVTGATNHGQYL